MAVIVLTVVLSVAAHGLTAGPLAARALEFARALGTPHRITVEEAPPEHSGFGTGTQLALAVGRAVSSLPTEEVARVTGRGRRSAIGTHGFATGGLLADGGRKDGIAPRPLQSTLNLAKIKATGFTPREWKTALRDYLAGQ